MNERELKDRIPEKATGGAPLTDFFPHEMLEHPPIDQYAVEPGKVYWIYFPLDHGPFIKNPYGARSGQTYRIAVYRVYEAPGVLYGTNRTVDGIDIDSGEYVTVAINHHNIWGMTTLPY